MAAVLDVRSSWRDRASIVTAGIRLGAGILAYVVTGKTPQNFLSKGYARLTDAEVSANFSPNALIEFVCGRGTIIAEDTRGLHKGKPVLKDDRLMFEFEFSNSLFGAELPSKGELAVLHQPGFAAFFGRHRRIFKRWIGAGTPR